MQMKKALVKNEERCAEEEAEEKGIVGDRIGHVIGMTPVAITLHTSSSNVSLSSFSLSVEEPINFAKHEVLVCCCIVGFATSIGCITQVRCHHFPKGNA
jgi:hypothetical protein